MIWKIKKIGEGRTIDFAVNELIEYLKKMDAAATVEFTEDDDALLLYNKNKYKDVVLEEIRRIYKIMLDDGSSTVWEVIEGERAFDNAGSLCHGWSATPIYYFKKLLYL